jgi:hypothetical protein
VSESPRQMAVRSMRSLRRVGDILDANEAAWSDVDEYLRAQFAEVRSTIGTLIADIEETYPGRATRRREVQTP